MLTGTASGLVSKSFSQAFTVPTEGTLQTQGGATLQVRETPKLLPQQVQNFRWQEWLVALVTTVIKMCALYNQRSRPLGIHLKINPKSANTMHVLQSYF